jgi:hypothetical protein
MGFIRTLKAGSVQPMHPIRIVILPILIGLAFAPLRASGAPAVPAGTTRILVYGDAGVAEEPQLQVARAMARRHSAKPFSFALSTGDNWYIDEPTEAASALKQIFEIPYAPLIQSRLVLYQTLGNHDHEANRMQTELEYARTHPSFGLPAPSYVIERPHLKLIVLDAANAESKVELPEERMKWLEKELCETAPSTGPKPWRVLSLHYQVFGTGKRGDFPELKQKLLPLLDRCPADFVLSGHEHHAELMEPRGTTWFVISGTGGAWARPARGKSELKSQFFSLEKGFAELTLTRNRAHLAFLDTSLKTLFEKSRTR